MTRAALLIACFFLSVRAIRAEDLRKSFAPGAGSHFKLDGTGLSGDLVITVASSASDRVNIEYYFSSLTALQQVEMWQQFQMERRGTGPVKVVRGYVLNKEMKTPEILEGQNLQAFDGLDLNAFLFPDKASLDQFKIGEESVTVPAGTVRATHYRQKQNGQTFDYWISDSARPIGLVKLVGKGGPTGGFSTSLESLVTHVAPKIDPAKATPLTKLGREMLPPPNFKP